MNHQRLKCYMVLLEVAKGMPRLTRAWPKGSGYLVDQPRRAMASCLLNVGEGNARRKPKERRHFFEIAVGSIAEVAAILDVAVAIYSSDKFECEKIKQSLRSAYKMISRLP